MKKNLLLSLSLFLLLSAFGQQNVYEITSIEQPLPKKTNGFFYLLPQTAFKIDVTITRTNFIKGYYADYAEKLLGLNNIIVSNETSYMLNDISISTFNLPDTQHLYYVELSPKQEKKSYLSHLYSHFSLDNSTIFDFTYSNYTTPLPNFFKNYSEITYTEKEDSFVETQIIDGVVTEVPVNKTKKVTKTVEEKAHEAADFIIQIRKDKYALTAGEQEVAYSKEALEFLTSELNQWEKNYLDLFTGISIEDTLHYSIIIVPKDEKDTLLPLFSLDPNGGYSITNFSNPINNYYLQLQPFLNHQKTQQFLLQKEKEEKFIPNNGYRIRKPAPAEILLLHNTKQVHKYGIFDLYQLGKIETLPVKNDNFNIEKFVYIY